MTEAPPQAPPPPMPPGPPVIRRRWFWLVLVLLVLSVMLNLFIGGVIAGRLSGAGGAAFGRLPPEVRTSVRQELFAERGDLRRALLTLRTARQDVRSALTADPFDEAAAAAALGRLRAATDGVQTIMHRAYVRAAERLPAETRRQIPSGERFMRRLERRMEALDR